MTGPRPKANGHKSADEDFTWSCGFCFFERRKKSTIKAHLIQKVCQKTVDHKKSKADSVAKRLMKRNHSCSELEADRFYFSWKDSLSVWERRCVLEIPDSTNLWFLEPFRCFQLILRKEKNQYSTDLPLCCFLTLEFGRMLYNIFFYWKRLSIRLYWPPLWPPLAFSCATSIKRSSDYRICILLTFQRRI